MKKAKAWILLTIFIALCVILPFFVPLFPLPDSWRHMAYKEVIESDLDSYSSIDKNMICLFNPNLIKALSSEDASTLQDTLKKYFIMAYSVSKFPIEIMQPSYQEIWMKEPSLKKYFKDGWIEISVSDENLLTYLLRSTKFNTNVVVLHHNLVLTSKRTANVEIGHTIYRENMSPKYFRSVFHIYSYWGVVGWRSQDIIH